MQSAKVRRSASALAVFLFGIGLYQAINLGQAPASPSSDALSGVWEHFSAERLVDLQKKRRPVFVDFTAKWCLICQANKISMFDKEVSKRFEEKGVVAMEGDWTRRDPAITDFLKEHGRNGVPLYLFYGSDPSKPPKVLPQTLTPDIILDCLDEIVD